MSIESWPGSTSEQVNAQSLRNSIDQCVAKIELWREEMSEDGKDRSLDIRVEERRLGQLREQLEKLS